MAVITNLCTQNQPEHTSHDSKKQYNKMNIVYKKLKKVYKSAQRVWGKETVIGNFTLKVDPENSQPYIIKKYPEHSMSLIRLARAIDAKYHNISVFDVGANFGDTAAMLLTDNPAYKVVCVEGDGPSFKLLSENFGKNQNVSLQNVFLGNKAETIEIVSSKEGGSLKLNDNDGNIKNKISITTIDSLLAGGKIAKPKVFKVDTDGYDYRILQGSKKYLFETKPALYFEYDNTYLATNGDKGLDIFTFLKECGYEHVLFYDNYGRFFLSATVNDTKLLNELDRYIMNRKGGFAYYDIVAFHSADNDIVSTFIKNETSRE